MTFRVRVWSLVVLLGVAALYLQFLSDVHNVPLRRPLSEVPLTLGGWQGRSYTMEDAIVKNVGVKDYILREYRESGDAFPVSAYVGYYERQREGETAHSPKHCLPGSGWSQVESKEVEFETPGFNGGKTRANRYIIAKGGERQLVLYWYQGRGRDTTNEYLVKAYLVLDSIFRKRNDGSLIRLMAPLLDPSAADVVQAKAVAFGRAFLPEVGRSLPE